MKLVDVTHIAVNLVQNFIYLPAPMCFSHVRAAKPVKCEHELFCSKLQYSVAELKSDADQLFDSILREDWGFSQVFPKIHHGNALAVVDEALHVLFHGPHPSEKDAPIEIYIDACLVISLLLQWLVRYLCRRLMQLLTPEALAVHLNKVPNVYVQSYLKLQEHFSLKNLMAKQFRSLEENHW